MKNAVSTLCEAALSVIDMVRKNPDNLNPNSLDYLFVLNNTYNSFINGLRDARLGVGYEAKRVGDLQQSIAFALLITLIIILSLFMLVVGPFIIYVKAQMAATLKLFLRIPIIKARIQFEKNKKFSVTFRAVSNAIGNKKDEDKNEKRKSGKNIKDPANQTKKQGDQHNQNASSESNSSDSEEESENSEEFRREEGKNLLKLHRNSSLGIKNIQAKHFVTYSSSVIQYILSLLFCCGILIGVYGLFYYYSNRFSFTLLFQIDELNRLTRCTFSQNFFLAYLMNFVGTQGKGYCPSQLCRTYLPTYVTTRTKDLYDMIVFHKGNYSLLSNEYNTLFETLFENNPCKKS